MLFYLFKSKRAYKKFAAVLIDNNKPVFEVHFGDLRYLDYTSHHDKKRKERYLARSTKIKDQQGRYTAKNILSSNFWSVHLLWSEKTLEKSIKKLEDTYDIKIVNKTDQWYDKKNFK